MSTYLNLPPGLAVLDRTSHTDPHDILYPFALEELLCRAIGKGTPPILHMWRHPRALVMGLRDSRLPHAFEAKQWLEERGVMTAVRNSGGAAVPLDLNVVNVSLLLPKGTGDMDHRKDFEQMVALIREVINTLEGSIAQGEVSGSFCPGEFDLSMDGRKFCGIAQRRQQHALSVQAFVIVAGAGEEKATLAKEFYDRAAVGAAPAEFPLVEQGRMASISECLGRPVTSEQFTDSVKRLITRSGQSLGADQIQLPAEEEIKQMTDLLRQRYEIRSKQH